MIVLLLVWLGLCIGSFLNAFVWRWHESEYAKTTKRKDELSISRGRSMCPNCSHSLSAADLVPVFSWLALRGKCRYCKKPISVQYPLIEVLAAVAFVLSFLVWPYGFEAAGIVLFITWLVILSGFVALSIYDFRWMLLPTKIVYTLLGILLAGMALYLFLSDSGPLQYALAGLSALIIGGLFYCLHMVSDGRWIGGGDVRLGYVLGLLVMSPVNAMLVIFLASLLGTIYALPYILRGRRNTHIPFGPFLMLAATIVFLSGDKLGSLLLVQ